MTSDERERGTTRSISVLHVDDEPDFADLVATYLERDGPDLAVETATSAAAALDRLDSGVDCVVSDYDMPGRNGVEFLRAVRERYPDLPFILFTGKGSEEVASEAITAGVTDYLQKQHGSDRYALLANRIRHAVEAHRSAREVGRHQDLLRHTERVAETGGWELRFPDERLRWTDGTRQIHGVAPGYEPTLEEAIEFYHPDDRQRVREAVETARETGEGYHFEARLRTADGDLRRVESTCEPVVRDGEVTALRGAVRDVTDRHRREQELATERDRFRTLFENLTQATVEVEYDEPADGDPIPVVQAVNPAFEAEFGFDAEEMVGESLDAFIVPPEREEEASDINDDVVAGGTLDRVEVRRLTADGPREFLLQNALYPDRPGGFAIYTDITERKRREERLREQNERLEQFASIVSHDLRNPLNVARGRLELARETGDEEQFDAVERAHDRMETLVAELLRLARGGDAATDTEPVSLATVAEGCRDLVATDGATYRVETDRRLRADESQLRQLLENLVRNAVEHGPEGVTVWVGDLPDGFYVADDGPGIPPERREHVFEAGYSSVESGTGFGLSIVEEVAESHGWNLAVAESADGGLRVEVTGVDVL